MFTNEAQLVEAQVLRPQGWNDESYEQFVELIALSQELERLGGAEGLLALVTKSEVNDVAVDAVEKSALNWIHGTKLTADVWSDGFLNRNIHANITTDDGHKTSASVTSMLGMLIPGHQTVKAQLGFNNWDALTAGTNTVTISKSGVAPIKVNGTVQGEITYHVPSIVPPFSLTFTFNWQ